MLGRMTTTATVQQQLSTPEGFAQAVNARGKAFSIGITSLVLGVAGLVINLLQIGSATEWRWWLIFRLFFQADALEFSSGRGQAWHYVYVYAPIVLVPLGIILLIVHLTTRKKAGAALYDDFRSRGWVGKQRYTGLKVKNGNAEVDTVLISHPSMPDETFDAIALQFQTSISALDKKAAKAFAAAAVKAGVLTGASGAAVSPGLPPEITVAPAQGKNEHAVVIPPVPGTTGKYRVLAIKN